VIIGLADLVSTDRSLTANFTSPGHNKPTFTKRDKALVFHRMNVIVPNKKTCVKSLQA
jgi:hypothetical protein